MYDSEVMCEVVYMCDGGVGSCDDEDKKLLEALANKGRNELTKTGEVTMSSTKKQNLLVQFQPLSWL